MRVSWMIALVVLPLALLLSTACEEKVPEPTEEELAARAEATAREATDGYFLSLETTLATAGLTSVSFLGVTDNTLDEPDLNVERQYGNQVLARTAKFSQVELYRQNSDIIKSVLKERGLDRVSDIGQEDIAAISEQISGECLVYGSVEDLEKKTIVLFAARKDTGRIVWGETLQTLYFSHFEPGATAEGDSTAQSADGSGPNPEGAGSGTDSDYNPWAIE